MSRHALRYMDSPRPRRGTCKYEGNASRHLDCNPSLFKHRARMCRYTLISICLSQSGSLVPCNEHFGLVDPTASSSSVFGTKMEIRLNKRDGRRSWTLLERPDHDLGPVSFTFGSQAYWHGRRFGAESSYTGCASRFPELADQTGQGQHFASLAPLCHYPRPSSRPRRFLAVLPLVTPSSSSSSASLAFSFNLLPPSSRGSPHPRVLLSPPHHPSHHHHLPPSPLRPPHFCYHRRSFPLPCLSSRRSDSLFLLSLRLARPLVSPTRSSSRLSDSLVLSSLRLARPLISPTCSSSRPLISPTCSSSRPLVAQPRPSSPMSHSRPTTRQAAKRPHRESNPPQYENTRPRIDHDDHQEGGMREGGTVAPRRGLDLEEATVRMDTMNVRDSKSTKARESELDNSMPLSPLTGVDDSEGEEDGAEPSGTVRWAKNGYLLEPDEDLPKPDEYLAPHGGVWTSGATEKAVRKAICKAIVEFWPNSKLDEAKATEANYGLANQCAFWFKVLRPVFEIKLKSWLNTGNKDDKIKADMGLKFFNNIEDQVKQFTPFHSGILHAFYQAFDNHLLEMMDKGEYFPPDLLNARKMSEGLRQQIKAAQTIGEVCLKQAKWIGLDKSNKDNCRKMQMDLHMVETKSLRAAGKHLNEDETLLLGSDWHRVCAPEESESKKMYSLIFWHQSNPEEKPSWDKVFGAVVYNPKGMSKTFSNRESSTLKAECAAIYQTVRNKELIERSSVIDQGAIFKHGGMQSNRSTAYQATVKVEKNTSAKPTPRVLQRIEEQKQVRIDLEREGSAIQSCSFALLMKFLPPLAYDQYKVAQEHQLINDLGTPNVSSFVAYAYSAGLHVDKDVCVSHGWVVERPSKVKREESNFVYGDFKLIVELSHDAHWFWRAFEDAHGSTSNWLAMTDPSNWQACIKSHPEDAQWTYAQTIPKAVADAALNMKPKSDF